MVRLVGVAVVSRGREVQLGHSAETNVYAPRILRSPESPAADLLVAHSIHGRTADPSKLTQSGSCVGTVCWEVR